MAQNVYINSRGQMYLAPIPVNVADSQIANPSPNLINSLLRSNLFDAYTPVLTGGKFKKTNKFTYMLGGNGGSAVFYSANPYAGGSFTYCTIYPLESHIVAFRPIFAMPFNATMNILGCRAFVSSAINITNGNLVPGKATGIPTGDTVGVTVGFDWATANVTSYAAGQAAYASDDWTINSAPVATSFVMPANGGNVPNADVVYYPVFGDWTPVQTIDRTDGGRQPLLFVYSRYALGSAACWGNGSTVSFPNLPNAQARGRNFISLSSSTGNAASLTDPTSCTWLGNLTAPDGTPNAAIARDSVLGIQVLSVTEGLQLVSTGDSLSIGGTPGGFPAYQRAAYDLSTPAFPIVCTSLGWGGKTSPFYLPQADNWMKIMDVSGIIGEYLSANDGATAAILSNLAAKNMALANKYKNKGVIPIYNTAEGCQPAWNGTNATTLFNNVRTFIGNIIENGAYGVDALSAICDNNAPWNYAPGLTSDGAHSNNAGMELMVPVYKQLFQKIFA